MSLFLTSHRFLFLFFYKRDVEQRSQTAERTGCVTVQRIKQEKQIHSGGRSVAPGAGTAARRGSGGFWELATFCF